ncbi:MAG: diguanylate cyclase [bacterium]
MAKVEGGAGCHASTNETPKTSNEKIQSSCVEIYHACDKFETEDPIEKILRNYPDFVVTKLRKFPYKFREQILGYLHKFNVFEDPDRNDGDDDSRLVIDVDSSLIDEKEEVTEGDQNEAKIKALKKKMEGLKKQKSYMRQTSRGGSEDKGVYGLKGDPDLASAKLEIKYDDDDDNKEDYRLKLRKNAQTTVDAIFNVASILLIDVRDFLVNERFNNFSYLQNVFAKIIEESCHKKDLYDKSKKVAYMFLDLNALKGVNDTLGHDAGNQLIIAYFSSLRKICDVKLFEKYGLNIHYGVRNGDEVDMIVESDKEISELGKNFLNSLSPENLKKLNIDIYKLSEEDLQKYGIEAIRQLILGELAKADVSACQYISAKGKKESEMNNKIEQLNLQGIRVGKLTEDEIKSLAQKYPDSQFEYNIMQKFVLSAGIGGSVLSSVLADPNIRFNDSTFMQIVGKLRKNIAHNADENCTESKDSIKDNIGKKNPLMKYLFSFRSNGKEKKYPDLMRQFNMIEDVLKIIMYSRSSKK